MCRLPDALQKAVLERLGLAGTPRADLDGLRTAYRAWCLHVPFDNVLKMIALRTPGGALLPGGVAEQFFEAWLADGTGGTCWPTSNALFELLRSLGFDAHRIGGSMRDLGILNHASLKVTIGACDWLVDTSLLSNEPFPLGDGVFVRNDPVFSAEVEFEDPTHVVWSHTPPNSTYLPCRLTENGMTRADYFARYEESRTQSPFNQHLYARRNRSGEMVVLLGNTRFLKTLEGVTSQVLQPEAVCEALRIEIGLSEKIIGQWVDAGGLTDSFAPPSGPRSPPVTRKPPSQR